MAEHTLLMIRFANRLNLSQKRAAPYPETLGVEMEEAQGCPLVDLVLYSVKCGYWRRFLATQAIVLHDSE